MKRKTIIIIIVVLIILAIVGYFLWKNYQNKKRQDLLAGVTETGTSPTSGPTSSGGSGYSDSFPLSMGSKGNNVLALQIAINEGCPQLTEKIAEDGDFGPQTEAAVDVCLGSQNGHQKGKVSYAEYQWLRKQVTTATELQIKKGCTASEGSRLMMKTVYGIDCADYGY